MNYTKVAVAAKEKDLRKRLHDYFKEYVLPQNNLDTFLVDEYEDIDHLFDEVNDALNQEYCFAVTAETFENPEYHQYDVQFDFSFNKGFIPDSQYSNYNLHIYAPNL